MMKPTKNAELAPLIAKLLPESIKKNMNKGARAAPMSGTCVIYEEFFSMPGTYSISGSSRSRVSKIIHKSDDLQVSSCNTNFGR